MLDRPRDVLETELEKWQGMTMIEKGPGAVKIARHLVLMEFGEWSRNGDKDNKYIMAAEKQNSRARSFGLPLNENCFFR